MKPKTPKKKLISILCSAIFYLHLKMLYQPKIKGSVTNYRSSAKKTISPKYGLVSSFKLCYICHGSNHQTNCRPLTFHVFQALGLLRSLKDFDPCCSPALAATWNPIIAKSNRIIILRAQFFGFYMKS